ncbi:MAG: ThuA domain-containing protein, partial [Novosphingobium sp.]|nr:ThuA domain-containing protein [Novosphingobium sp.]
MIRQLLIGAAVLASLCASAVAARPVTDCPNRDAPFSADAPMIDLLLSDAARAVLEREMGP